MTKLWMIEGIEDSQDFQFEVIWSIIGELIDV